MVLKCSSSSNGSLGLIATVPSPSEHIVHKVGISLLQLQKFLPGSLFFCLSLPAHENLHLTSVLEPQHAAFQYLYRFGLQDSRLIDGRQRQHHGSEASRLPKEYWEQMLPKKLPSPSSSPSQGINSQTSSSSTTSKADRDLPSSDGKV